MKEVDDFERGVISGEIVGEVLAQAEAEIRIGEDHTAAEGDDTAEDDPIRISAESSGRRP